LDEEVISTASTLSLSGSDNNNDFSSTTPNAIALQQELYHHHHRSILKSSSSNKILNMNDNTTQNNNQFKRRRSVRLVQFGSIEIHEHAIELGCCCIPSTRGPSIQLEWNEQAYYKINSVIEYETLRKEEEEESSSSCCRQQQRRIKRYNNKYPGPSPTSQTSTSTLTKKKQKQLLLSRNQRIDLLLLSGSCTYRQIQRNEEECDIIRQKRSKTNKSGRGLLGLRYNSPRLSSSSMSLLYKLIGRNIRLPLIIKSKSKKAKTEYETK
jgi:hypothetical protein